MTDDALKDAGEATDRLMAFLDSPIGWAEADLIFAVQDAAETGSTDAALAVHTAGALYLAADKKAEGQR